MLRYIEKATSEGMTKVRRKISFQTYPNEMQTHVSQWSKILRKHTFW